MSDPLATYAFLPWLRRGMSADIERVDGTGQAARATIPVTLVFNRGPEQQAATAHLALYGPGEVASIDPRAIVRTDPRPNVTDAESNYFPLIEFDQPDFPWRYTPASATAGDRLHPWIVLIALADTEIAGTTSADVVRRSLATVSLNDSSALPDLAQSWAWAHVQVVGVDRAAATDAVEVARIDGEEPQRTLSRLLCARHLLPRTAYTAYLVPAFERGRLAGLNQQIGDEIDALTPAWQARGTTPVVLPVYYQWRFQTADSGDFESLVRELLPPRVLSEDVGRRPLDASNPGSGLPPATRAGGAPLTLEGALMSPASRDSSPPWIAAAPFVDELQRLLNAPTELLANVAGTRAVAPPLYGRWHAARTRLEAARSPSWFDELNRDPQLRAPAGLGVRVVQEQQSQLVAAAWDQVEGILAANKQLREAQLGSAVAARLVERDLLSVDASTLVQITAPILARVMASPRTIRATLDASPIARGALDAQFRRATRPLGPIGRRQSRTVKERSRFGVRAAGTGRILQRMNLGELPHPAPTAGTKLRGIKAAAGRLLPKRSAMTRFHPLLLGLVALASFVLAAFAPTMPLRAAVVALGAVAGVIAWVTLQPVLRRNVLARLQSGKLSAGDVVRASPARNFMPHERGFGAVAGPTTFSRAQAAANFQNAFARVASRLQRSPALRTARPQADFAHLQRRIMDTLRPEELIPAALGPRIRLLPGANRDPQSCNPIMAAPTFEQPMYGPLRDLSQDWLLPGVGAVPPNTVSLLVTNQRFVEGYMLGLNFEMGRELLWHEYPTDQRGTYFRQFWDVRGFAGPAKTELRDIRAIHQWEQATRLGTHRPTVRPPGDDLVLLVRGRLLSRYPNTIIVGVRATLPGASSVAEGGKRELSSTTRYPLFHGTLTPDITFVGFDLRREEVMGDDTSTAAADQGWFFVFQEQPTAPRFGLEAQGAWARSPVPAWDDLSWSDLVRSQSELDALTYVDLDPPVTLEGEAQLPYPPRNPPAGEPGLAWHASQGSRSSDLAYITLQKPFRVAIHGSDMLPPA